MSQEIQELQYALAKQLDNINFIDTNYGQLDITFEEKEAVAKVLAPKLRKRLRELEHEEKNNSDKNVGTVGSIS